METVHKNRKLHRDNNGVEEKACNDCMLWKSLDKFSKGNAWDKLDRRCKECCKKYREENKPRLLAKKKEYRDNNKDKRAAWLEANKDAQAEYNKEYHKKYREEHAEKLKRDAAARFQENKEKINEAARGRRKIDPKFRIANNLRSRLGVALKDIAKSAATMELLGCSVDFLKDHLEFQFDDKMTWNNYGEWHVDHIIPCAAFDLTDPNEQKMCFHYANLQPMWGSDNIAKSDNITLEMIEAHTYRLSRAVIDRLMTLL